MKKVFFYKYHLIVRQQILPQNIWYLSLTRRFYPSHMMWHNHWPQTQNISADVNTFSFHVLSIADQAKFHFTEKTTFFPDCVEERNLLRFRRDTCISVHLDCNLCSFQLKTPLQGSWAKKWEFAAGEQTPREFLTSLPPLVWAPLARLHSAKRGIPGKNCKSESRNLYKHCAELKYWISTSPLSQPCKSAELMLMINI